MSDWTAGRGHRERMSSFAEPGPRRREDESRSFGRDERQESRETRRSRGWAGEPSGGYRFGRRDNRRFDNRDEEYRVPRDETNRLIASDKVEGTRVFSHYGDRLGTIENFMVDKRSGTVEYAVMSFGGTFGMGDRHYPLPWNMLNYDEELGGYVIDLTPRDLERAPSHRAESSPDFDRSYRADIHDYYGW